MNAQQLIAKGCYFCKCPLTVETAKIGSVQIALTPMPNERGITKRQTKRSPHIIYRDLLDMAHPCGADIVAVKILKTLNKSLAKTHGLGKRSGQSLTARVAVVLDGRNFSWEM